MLRAEQNINKTGNFRSIVRVDSRLKLFPGKVLFEDLLMA